MVVVLRSEGTLFLRHPILRQHWSAWVQSWIRRARQERSYDRHQHTQRKSFHLLQAETNVQKISPRFIGPGKKKQQMVFESRSAYVTWDFTWLLTRLEQEPADDRSGSPCHPVSSRTRTSWCTTGLTLSPCLLHCLLHFPRQKKLIVDFNHSWHQAPRSGTTLSSVDALVCILEQKKKKPQWSLARRRRVHLCVHGLCFWTLGLSGFQKRNVEGCSWCTGHMSWRRRDLRSVLVECACPSAILLQSGTWV